MTSLDTPIFSALAAEMQALKQEVLDLELRLQQRDVYIANIAVLLDIKNPADAFVKIAMLKKRS